MIYLKSILGTVAREGLNYAADAIRTYIPKVKSTKNTITEKLAELAEEAEPALDKTKAVSKHALDKYSEAVNLKKKAEKELKKNRAKTIRNTIIATTLGFGAGAATGYVLIKKSQIKESDYVFTDDTVAESLPKTPVPPVTEVMEAPAPEIIEQKTYDDFDETYKISADGTTLIKK